MPTVLSSKLGDREGLALSVHSWLLKRTLLVVLTEILIQILIHASLIPVPVYCWGQPATSRCCLAAAGRTPAPTAPNSGKLSIGFVYFVLFLLLLILLVLLVLLVKVFKYSFCKFLSFIPSCWGGVWAWINREHLPLCLLLPCSKQWHKI